MSKHRKPPKRLPKRPLPDNLAIHLLVRRLYEALVELEALAIPAVVQP